MTSSQSQCPRIEDSSSLPELSCEQKDFLAKMFSLSILPRYLQGTVEEAVYKMSQLTEETSRAFRDRYKICKENEANWVLLLAYFSMANIMIYWPENLDENMRAEKLDSLLQIHRQFESLTSTFQNCLTVVSPRGLRCGCVNGSCESLRSSVDKPLIMLILDDKPPDQWFSQYLSMKLEGSIENVIIIGDLDPNRVEGRQEWEEFMRNNTNPMVNVFCSTFFYNPTNDQFVDKAPDLNSHLIHIFLGFYYRLSHLVNCMRYDKGPSWPETYQ